MKEKIITCVAAVTVVIAISASGVARYRSHGSTNSTFNPFKANSDFVQKISRGEKIVRGIKKYAIVGSGVGVASGVVTGVVTGVGLGVATITGFGVGVATVGIGILEGAIKGAMST